MSDRAERASLRKLVSQDYGLSRTKLSEVLGTSSRSLVRYMRGERPIPATVRSQLELLVGCVYLLEESLRKSSQIQLESVVGSVLRTPGVPRSVGLVGDPDKCLLDLVASGDARAVVAVRRWVARRAAQEPEPSAMDDLLNRVEKLRAKKLK